jgi:hypothetical protein
MTNKLLTRRDLLLRRLWGDELYLVVMVVGAALIGVLLDGDGYLPVFFFTCSAIGVVYLFSPRDVGRDLMFNKINVSIVVLIVILAATNVHFVNTAERQRIVASGISNYPELNNLFVNVNKVTIDEFRQFEIKYRDMKQGESVANGISKYPQLASLFENVDNITIEEYRQFEIGYIKLKEEEAWENDLSGPLSVEKLTELKELVLIHPELKKHLSKKNTYSHKDYERVKNAYSEIKRKEASVELSSILDED